VYLRAAARVGLAVPPVVLVRADKVRRRAVLGGLAILPADFHMHPAGSEPWKYRSEAIFAMP
jgi:hypothetical protein